MAELAELISAGSAVGIGSPRASLEGNVALKSLVGEDNFCAGFASAEAGLVELALEICGVPHGKGSVTAAIATLADSKDPALAAD